MSEGVNHAVRSQHEISPGIARTRGLGWVWGEGGGGRGHSTISKDCGKGSGLHCVLVVPETV